MGLTSSVFANDDSEETFYSSDLFHEIFSNMRHMRRKSRFTDVKLTVEEGSCINAHRKVLATAIPYFNSMLSINMREKNLDTIIIKEIKADILETLVNFAYTGVLTVNINTVQRLLFGANFFQMEEAKLFCCDFVKKRLDPDNVVGWHNYSQMLSLFWLVEKTKRFICKHFIDVANSEEFIELTMEKIIEILSYSELHVLNEMVIFKAAKKWVMHDAEVRKKVMHKLLRKIRLPLLSKRLLTNMVHTDPTCKDCPKCQELIREAKKFHQLPHKRNSFQSDQVTSRYCSAITSVIYVVDLVNSYVEKLSPLLGKWEKVTGNPTLKSGSAVAAFEGNLYVIGGWNDKCQTTKTVEVFSHNDNQWRDTTPMNTARYSIGCCFWDGKLYVCGGCSVNNLPLSSCEMFDPHTREWSPVPNMKEPRDWPAMTCFEGGVWVLGGGDPWHSLNTVEFYDPWIDSWSSSTPMLSRRRRSQAASIGDKMFVFGGSDGRRALNSCEQFDRITRQFTFIKPMARRRYQFGVTVSGGRIYCMGGFDGQTLKCVEVYDPEAGEWSAGPDMLSCRITSACTIISS